MSESCEFLPVEVVFAPKWWHRKHGIRFDRDFFFNPDRRVRDELCMRQILAETFGDIGLGDPSSALRPVIGAVHLAAGYFIAEALGCRVVYHEDNPPDVIPANISDDALEAWTPPELHQTKTMLDFVRMVEDLKDRFGYVEGDVNWSGVHNTALDLRGNALFLDYYDRPDAIKRFLSGIADFILAFVEYLESVSESTSHSVNRIVDRVDPRLHLHSNCSVTMLSSAVYDEFLLPIEKRLCERLQPYGIHHCGGNMDVMAASYASAGNVEVFDVGWGSDIRKCRELLPDAFLSLRLSPAEMAVQNPGEIANTIHRLIADGGPLDKIGLCCINLDDTVPDENIRALFHTVEKLKCKGNTCRY